MKKPQTVTDDKGNIYIVPGRMTREEAMKEYDLVYVDPETGKRTPVYGPFDSRRHETP
jgi:hypothetical protein